MEKYIYGLSYSDFFSLVDNMYDELLIYDKNCNIVYINRACSRHYGCDPKQMIGKNFYDFVHADWWGPSILPIVLKEKRAYAIKQSTFLGSELLTIAVPIFDKNNEIRFVVMNVRDIVNEVDLYNPHYLSIKDQPAKTPEPVYSSAEMQNVIQLIKRLAPLDTSCIFWGESGTGKAMLARYMHSLSSRAGEPFAYVDCFNLPEDRGQQELFGTEDSPGVLYNMRKSTVLLKRVSELSLGMQAQLLRYLNGELSFHSEQRARILATTEKDLRLLAESDLFLKELYYKLNVSEVYVPPLRKRPADIRPLIQFFLGKYCSRYNTNRSFTKGALQLLIHADWYGNVLELRNTIERIVVMSDTPTISTDQLPKTMFGLTEMTDMMAGVEAKSLDARMEMLEASIIRDAYQEYKTSRRVAEALGISQTRANNLIRKYVKEPNKA